MSCSSYVRSGFIMRTFLSFGSLIVTRGLGSCGNEIISAPLGLTLPEGVGRRVKVGVASARAPKALIRYPDKKSGKCDDD